ncbi:iron complex transport system substrate-binding protein [Solibacillus kalamii]|uniref:Iron ABC transporter substrate-binding protein n=1 Tax=Solibacillus kalamii TaxID=1748298 RepID=A0ABX3ZGD5_9BACL|nr:ABC transporter substrate-binding protein [Solibacillus kalamii]MBM7665792.1 iron complex transport system substrate-binding protein [Solibacillus kalamii]OUZ38764.1 iron ABC transporter substrate-binding protein [Solibacillus kalamii]
MKLRKKIWAPIALASALILGACSGYEQNIKQVTADSEETSQAITIENDGVSITYDEAPKKAISINQHVTEVMLALGLEDSMVGTAYLDDQIYPPLQEAYDQVPVLAEQYPSKEQVISTEADFIYGGWASAFNEKNLMSREEMEQLGIGSYLQSSSVKVAPELEDIYTDIRNIAKIFRVEERGETLIEKMNADIEKIKEKVPTMDKPINVLVFDSGDKDVFTATQNFLNTLVKMAGANNIFGDIEKNWATVSKEDAVERNPEAIIVIDYGSTTAEEKINFLKNDPALSQTPAVQNERFVVLPLSAASEGVRVAEALEIIVKGLYPDSF